MLGAAMYIHAFISTHIDYCNNNGFVCLSYT